VGSRLRPISELWEWQIHGRCRDRAAAQFFHPDDDLGRIRRGHREDAAKRICAGCPVRSECATHALTAGEVYGVWGGFAESEHRRLRRLGWQDALNDDRLVDIARLQRLLRREHP
jgi:WhiB family redox-sensing transcriptional regulator